jgi:Cof subfamily protein (haloacid dehalogenase superfamily)
MTDHKGWIALDIDGTITDQSHHIYPPVVDCFRKLYEIGWKFIFITGRTYSFGTSALHVLDFPFFLALQNGADILQMPEKKLISRCYLPADLLDTLETLCKKESEDFIVYSGYEKGDFCYYRPHCFSQELLRHLEKIKTLSPEPWQAVESFQFASEERFPLVKCLGSYEKMRAVNQLLEPIDTIAVSLIRDPLDEEIYLNLITDPLATKGNALERIIAKVGQRNTVIAAGDDRNDISMLKRADISIVMGNAPQEMLQGADIIAKPASQMGIIEALKQATRRE